MALPKCSCILVLMGLLSLSICSALETPTFPSMPLPKNAPPITVNTDLTVTESGMQGGLGDSKWSGGGAGGVSPPGVGGYGPRGGGYPGGYGGGGGNGFPGAGGFGRGGWGGSNGYPGAGAGGGYPGAAGGGGYPGAGGGYPGAGGGGYGGYPGAGGAGGGGMSPPAGEPMYCRPVNCDNQNTCRGFTVYLNSLEEEASYIMS